MKILRLHDSLRFGAPAVAGASPNPVANDGLTRITVLGKNFINAPTVTVSGVPATSVVRLTDSLLTCSPPAGAIGVKDLVVTNPDGQGSGTSGNGLLTYVAFPSVSSITPNNGTAAGGTAITDLIGLNFVNGATVTIGGAPATSVVFVSSTKLTCITPASLAGAKNVVVTNPDTGTSGATGNGLFTYNSPFDPATFNLTSWQQAPFASLPWLGAASAGSSATRQDSQYSSFAVPTASSELLNGHAGARYKYAQPSQVASRVNLVAGGTQIMEDLVSNATYTFSFFGRILGAGKTPTNTYEAGQFMSADAHWGWGYSSPASVNGGGTLTFDAAAHTITRQSGDFAADGFLNGQSVWAGDTTLNDGLVGVLIGVSALVLTFASGLINETTGSSNVRLVGGQGVFRVFHYNGAFPTVTVNLDPGLHWVYVRHTGVTTQIDVDGVAGSAQAHPDHTGSSGTEPRTNVSTYIVQPMAFTQWERFTAQISQTNTDRTNYALYLNARYGTAF